MRLCTKTRRESAVENIAGPINEQQSGSLRDILTVLFKHKYKVLIVFFVIAAAVTAATFLIPATYEASSTLLVKIGREYLYRPEVTDKAPVVSINQEEALNSEINIITSRDLIKKVITTLGLAQIYPDLAGTPLSATARLEAAITRFNKSLRVEVLRKSNVLQVNFRHNDPELAARAVNVLVEGYKEKHFLVYNGPESAFLRNQLASFEQKLRDSEDEVQRFKQIKGVYSLDEQRALLLRQRSELDVGLKNSRSRIEGMQKRLHSLASQMQQMGESPNRYTQTERDKIIVEARSQLLERQFREQELLSKYHERNPLVVKVRKEIALVQEFLKQQEEEINSKVKTGNSVYQGAEKEALVAQADLEFELAREKIQRGQLARLEQEISALDLKEKELQTLKREVATHEKNYRVYQERVEEARIAEDMKQQKLANLSVIQIATPPAKPVKPNIPLNIALGALFAAVCGVGYAFICQYASQGLSTPEALEERLGLPVLTSIELKR